MSENLPVQYLQPTADLLITQHGEKREPITREENEANCAAILAVLESYGICATLNNSVAGPQTIRYELTMADEKQMPALAALKNAFGPHLRTIQPLRILTPIPGMDCCGIEIPVTKRRFWTCAELFAEKSWTDSTAEIPLLLGRDTMNATVVLDLAQAPHILLAGGIDNGITTCLRQFIASLLLKFAPNQLQLLIFSSNNDYKSLASLPHLVEPPTSDVKCGLAMLKWLETEKSRRQQLLAEAGVSSIDQFNAAGNHDILPRMVVILDEIVPLLQDYPEEFASAIEGMVAAGTVGMHVIASTSEVNSEILQDEIADCFSWRVAFGGLDEDASNLILGCDGAECLLAQGDILFRGTDFAQRLQCGTITKEDLRIFARHCAKYSLSCTNQQLISLMEDARNTTNSQNQGNTTPDTPMLPFADEPILPPTKEVTADNAPKEVPEPHNAVEVTPEAEPVAAPAPGKAGGPALMALDVLKAILEGTPATVEDLTEELGLSADRAEELLNQLTTHKYLGPAREDGTPRLLLVTEMPAEDSKRKTIEDLYNELQKKIAEGDTSSRTVKEFNAGVHAIGKKIVEEAAEVWMSAEYEATEHTAEEISQLFYHLVVLMLRKEISLEELYRYL